MRRRELKKAISKYAKENKFYKYGLIAKYLKHFENEKKKLYNSLPKLKCPYCGGNDIELEYSDCEYSDYTWLSCQCCGEDFEDDFGYSDIIKQIECIPYWDSIYNRISCDDNIDFKSIEWKEYCEEIILKEISK